MLELNGDTLKFTFPEIHPDAELTITFIRTLRIPDDDKTYPLPPALGTFPLQHVDDHRERVPAKWLEHGGVMLPMYQAEALWIRFTSKNIPKRQTRYPFAVKIGTGKISAITGDEWVKVMTEDDYCVVPEQPHATVLMALAGKISPRLVEIISKRPELFASVIEQFADLADHAIVRVVREVRDGEW